MAEKERHYTKHLKEQRELDSIITDKLVPYFSSQLNIVKPIFTSFLSTREMSREDWKIIYDIAEKCVEIMSETTTLIAFQHRYIEDMSYKLKHSTFYFVEAMQYAKCCVNHIESAEQQMQDTEKSKGIYNYYIYLAAQHLFFFITVKEKLGITD